MVARSESFTVGICTHAGSRLHSVSASVYGHEERLREWELPLCCDGVSEEEEEGGLELLDGEVLDC